MENEVKRERPPHDSVERALDQVGDRWTFLVLREAFFGVRRFDEFLGNTGISPAVLTDRLKKLVEHDVLAKQPYGSHPNRFEYRLTEKGLDLYPMIVLLMRWGDRWLDDGDGPPITLHHRTCGNDLRPTLPCEHCGEELRARDVGWRPRHEPG